MRRYKYLQHLLFQRSLDLREKCQDLDAPGASEKKKRRDWGWELCRSGPAAFVQLAAKTAVAIVTTPSTRSRQ